MIHFLYGPNHYAISTERRRLIDEFIKAHGQHSIERLEAENTTTADLKNSLNAGSLFSSDRCVVLNNPALNKALWEDLADISENLPDDVFLLIVEPAADKRTKTFKSLSRKSTVFEAKQLDERQLISWVQNQASEAFKVTISAESSRYLVQRVGNDQTRLFQEMKKLSVYESIDNKLIDQLVEPTPQLTVFGLLDAVFAGNPQRARLHVDELIASEDPYKTFGLLSSQIYGLALISAGQKEGISMQSIAKDSGIHPFVLQKLEPIARQAEETAIKKMIEEMAELDTALKTSGLEPWALLENTMMKIASRKA